jgi:hypothetical protein
MPTLGAYRRRLAETAGFYTPYITTAGASSPDQVVIADLISAGGLENSFLGNTWLYQPTGPNAGQARRVGYNGLDVSSGTVLLDRAFSTLTPIGTPVEVYGRMPPVTMEGRLGLNAVVNRVLDECWTVRRCDVLATIANQKYFELNDIEDPGATLFPWLTEEDRIVDVFSRGADAVSDPEADDQLMATWQWVSNADNPTLQVGRALNSGDMLRILAVVPMSWWILPAGTSTWTMPATYQGLQTETDQALIGLNGMELVGKAYVYDELAKWGLPDDQATYRQLASRARAGANQWKRLTLERPNRRTLHWPKSLSVPSRWGYSYGASWGMVTRA